MERFLKNISLFLILAITINVNAQQKKVTNQPNHLNSTLAEVGGKTISLKDFYERSEYTIRPAYCREDNNVHKKIILNSLIAEKLFALENESSSKLLESNRINRVLLGRKEQAMRKELQRLKGYNKVKLDTNEIKFYYKTVGRKYRVNFINISTPEEAKYVEQELKKKSVAEIHYELTADSTTPYKEIEWSRAENQNIVNRLFSDTLRVGQKLGPIPNSGGLLFVEILGWTNRVPFSEKNMLERWNEVSTWLTQKHGVRIYSEYISQVMKGKRIVFNPDVFVPLVKEIAPIYLKSKKEKEDEFLNKTIKKNDSNVLENLGDGIEPLREKELFKIDNEVWTVAMLEKEMDRHPLVFRQKKFSNNEFPAQFKLAVVDLIRDRFLNNEAYKMKLDTLSGVKNYHTKWKDALVSLYESGKILNSSTEKNQIKKIQDTLEPVVENLQKKYSNQIFINTDLFNSIKLTRTDMFVVEQNVPFPVYVPAFPLLTTDNKLDYGNKLEADKRTN